MSNSNLITYTKISPNKTVGRNHKIDTVAIHCMAGNLSVETCGNLFARSTTKASSNYGIGSDGRIGLYVEEKDRSWCTSSSAVDNRAITIEVASEAVSPYRITDKAYKALIKLLVDICKRNGILKLVWSDKKSDRINHVNGCNMECHRDHANKACPGDYIYSREGKIAEEVNKELKKTSSTKKTIFRSYKVKITTDILNIRKGAGTSYSKNGWGKLKSGAGWISLKYTKKV